MWLDKQLEFSDSQAVTATAISTNVVDLNTAFNYNTGVDIGRNAAMSPACRHRWLLLREMRRYRQPRSSGDHFRVSLMLC
jgi:hypothetical protein